MADIKLKNWHYKNMTRNINGRWGVLRATNPRFIFRGGAWQYMTQNEKPNFFKEIVKPTDFLNSKLRPLFIVKRKMKLTESPFLYKKSSYGNLSRSSASYTSQGGVVTPLDSIFSGWMYGTRKIWKNTKTGKYFIMIDKIRRYVSPRYVITKNNVQKIAKNVLGNNTGFFNAKFRPIRQIGKKYVPATKAKYVRKPNSLVFREINNTNNVPLGLRPKNPKQDKMVAQFLKDLSTDPEKQFDKYYIPMFKKLYSKGLKITAPTTKLLIDKIQRQIGPCHLNPTASREISEKYLPQFVQQFLYIVTEYTKLSESKKSGFILNFADKLGGRPCLENALHEGVEALLEPGFMWTGKQIKEPLTARNMARYLNNVVRPALMSWKNSMNNANKLKLNNMSLNQKKNAFWNKIKNRNIHMLTRNGIPTYGKVKEFNILGRMFKNSELANQLEWI